MNQVRIFLKLDHVTSEDFMSNRVPGEHIYNVTDEDIKVVDDHLNRLKETKNRQDTLEPAPKIAIYLHDNLCIANHADGCGWHYEISRGIHNWIGNEHKTWLCRARKLVDNGFDIKTVISFVEAIRPK